jgi:hypothetical protein
MISLDQDSYILNVAKEIIEDIESGQITAESISLKALRLAKLAGSEEVKTWLWYETRGYNASDPIAIKYLGLTRRKISNSLTLWGSVGAQESAIEAAKIKLEQMKYNPEPRRTLYGNTPMPTSAESLAGSIGYYLGVITAVRGLIHNFATSVYHERAFSKINQEIFESYKAEVDGLLAETAGAVLEKIPSIYARLNDGNTEAVSHALSSCRRVIDSFADAICPARPPIIGENGNEILLGTEQKKNRINQYILEHTTSSSRRTKLRQTLTNLYDRVSAGVHSDVDISEAKSLFFETYLLLGEILTL